MISERENEGSSGKCGRNAVHEDRRAGSIGREAKCCPRHRDCAAGCECLTWTQDESCCPADDCCGNSLAIYGECGRVEIGGCRCIAEGLRDAIDDGDGAAGSEAKGAAIDGDGGAAGSEGLRAYDELALRVRGQGV